MEVTFRSDQEYYYQKGGRGKQIYHILRLNVFEYLHLHPLSFYRILKCVQHHCCSHTKSKWSAVKSL